MIIGIVGTLGAGKGTVVAYLKEKGFVHYSVSNILKQTALNRGLLPSREVYTILGDEFRTENPAGPVAKSYELFIIEKPDHAIIESIHDVPEALFLREKGAFIIGVDASIETRYERIKKRGSEKDNVTFDEFKAIATHEEEGGGKHNIRAVLEKADYTIENNGTLEELHAQVEEILKKIGQ